MTERVLGIGGVFFRSLFPAETPYFGSHELRAAGVRVDDRVEEIENGRFGWATDPEGNRFELWEPR